MKVLEFHPAALDPVRTGIALGVMMGLWHLSWSLLVAVGWAQRIVDFVFWMHFLKSPYIVQPFNVATALVLVTVTLFLGFVVGSIFALLWNWMHKR